MNRLPTTTVTTRGAALRPLTRPAVLAAVVIAAFAKPLFDLARFAAHNELYSHILMIPFISAYLIWIRRQELAIQAVSPRPWAALPLLAGVGAVAGYWLALRAGWRPAREDSLAVLTLAFLCCLAGVGLTFLDRRTLRMTAAPAAFLIFMIPFPVVVRGAIETFYQHTSADAAYVLFKLADMPVMREGLTFNLPGMSLQVAPECSGIHSSLVLFITSCLASYLFLVSRWRRAVLILAVIPLGFIRNGFRVFVIGELCVYVDPRMIDSPIHHRGGPIFFALSLFPFFGLMYLLRWSENRKKKKRKT